MTATEKQDIFNEIYFQIHPPALAELVRLLPLDNVLTSLFPAYLRDNVAPDFVLALSGFYLSQPSLREEAISLIFAPTFWEAFSQRLELSAKNAELLVQTAYFLFFRCPDGTSKSSFPRPRWCSTSTDTRSKISRLR
jgi:hypothetical protein